MPKILLSKLIKRLNSIFCMIKIKVFKKKLKLNNYVGKHLKNEKTIRDRGSGYNLVQY